MNELEELRRAVEANTAAVAAHTQEHVSLRQDIRDLFNIARGAQQGVGELKSDLAGHVRRIDDRCAAQVKSCKQLRKAETHPVLPTVNPAPETTWHKIRPVIVAAVPYVATGFITAIVTCWHGVVSMFHFLIHGGSP
jgi:hypothetical protein